MLTELSLVKLINFARCVVLFAKPRQRSSVWALLVEKTPTEPNLFLYLFFFILRHIEQDKVGVT